MYSENSYLDQRKQCTCTRIVTTASFFTWLHWYIHNSTQYSKQITFHDYSQYFDCLLFTENGTK